jgi:hypothetical protein
MSFTRFHDDPNRITKELEQSTYSGRYWLDTPGPGMQMPFMNDPQIRMQNWGANLMTDTTNLESELRGLGRPLTHNPNVTYQDARLHQGMPLSYPVSDIHVEESRATHPAWMYKDQDHTRWETPFLNPQANLEKKFNHNIQTRILEKDYYVPYMPDLVSHSRDNLV